MKRLAASLAPDDSPGDPTDGPGSGTPPGTRPGERATDGDATTLRVRSRVWLDRDGDVFGVGICRLLRGVEATGSLAKAAADMGLAYSKAWTILRRAERELGLRLLVDRRAGGSKGGGSTVSDDGRWLVATFEAIDDEARELVERRFEERLRARLGAAGDDGRADRAGRGR